MHLLQPGDKILKCSASFGDDIWDAKQFGNVVYAIKTRNGAVYLQIQSNGGDMAVMKVWGKNALNSVTHPLPPSNPLLPYIRGMYILQMLPIVAHTVFRV